MFHFKKTTIVNLLLSIIISVFAVALITYAAWSEPTAAPTAGNVPAPINVGDESQVKSGALGVGGVFMAFSDLIVAGNVGIGTTNPTATLQLDGTAKIFGTPTMTGLFQNTVYEALSDGFVSAWSTKDGAWVRAFTGPDQNLVNNGDPSVEWGRHTKGGEGGVLMPVRKGEYWRVTITSEPKIYWIPFGN